MVARVSIYILPNFRLELNPKEIVWRSAAFWEVIKSQGSTPKWD
jgi:hypothetical protein